MQLGKRGQGKEPTDSDLAASAEAARVRQEALEAEEAEERERAGKAGTGPGTTPEPGDAAPGGADEETGI